MIYRERSEVPEHVYPIDEWRVIERSFYPRFLGATESIFATANGYLGMRGTFEEGKPAFRAATLINGFYESWPIVYGEEAYGFARTGQTIVNVPDATTIKLYVDDEPFFLATAALTDFERVLDMRAGTLERRLVWETQAGKRIAVTSRRLVSLQHRHLAAIAYEVTVLDGRAPVVLSSELRARPDRDGAGGREGWDPRQASRLAEQILEPGVRHAAGTRQILGFTTHSSRMALACGVDHVIETACPHSVRTTCSETLAELVVAAEAQPGEPIRLIKLIAYHTSRSAPTAELVGRTGRTLDRAVEHGFDDLLAGQREYLDDFWRRSDVELRGDRRMQQALRFNLFQLCQATARAEGAGIPAKGLTGEGYEGHYFWDAEIYLMPFLIYTAPRIARNLLAFRHSMLENAHQRARQMSQAGALFPWRTINGDEASAYYAAGTAQYHLNADIMYALRKYVNATGDEDFLFGPGVEMLVETARLWRDLGFFSERRDGRFCIDGVTGPDEYNTVVNNNTFTNLMARENLWFAADAVEMLRERRPERFIALVHETRLDLAEVAEWRRAADDMYVPYDDDLGIHPQDDAFLFRAPWDFANTPREKYPLLLHYHPLVIYRHQVIKQADVVLAMFLLGNEFSDEQKKRNFDYYDPLTTGDSSLSCSIQAIIAAEVGYVEKAREYALSASLMDLADVAGNVKDGCHIASMGGTWMVLVHGLAGFRDYRGALTFKPHVPRTFDGIRFPLTVRGQRLEVDIAKDGATYSLVEGTELTIKHYDREVTLTVGNPVHLATVGPVTAEPAPAVPAGPAARK